MLILFPNAFHKDISYSFTLNVSSFLGLYQNTLEKAVQKLTDRLESLSKTSLSL